MGKTGVSRIYKVFKNSLLLQIAAALLFGAFGWFAFIHPTRYFVPITREEAETYSGEFEAYDSKRKCVRLNDGSSYSFYEINSSFFVAGVISGVNTLPDELTEALENMEQGTKLILTVNPKAGIVIEARTETEELLNFDSSQARIYKYCKGYIWIGVLLIVLPSLALILMQIEKRSLKKEAERQEKRKEKDAAATPPRDADLSKKGRILLRATAENYTIVYRRFKCVNELIVNGKVYDEKKAVIEVAHNLCAVVDDHTIEAGLDEDSRSYIRFDGFTVAEKDRIV